MGKIIIIFTSLITCIAFSYIAFNHDFSDFCNVRIGEYQCSEWNVLSILTFAFTYLFYGALVGWGIYWLLKKFDMVA